MAKKSQLNTAYKSITDKITMGAMSKAKFGTHPNLVAMKILEAVRSDRPLLRYHVGDDAYECLEARRSKTDAEFESFLKKIYAYGNIRLWD